MISPVSSFAPPKHLLNYVKHICAIAVAGLCCHLLWGQISKMDVRQIREAVGQVTPLEWSGAAIATWASFHAIGRYDAVWHRILKTDVSPDQAHRAGIRAVALSQFLGFGAFTSSLVRWRLLPNLSLWTATQLSLAVTVTFFVCWTGYAFLATLWMGQTGDELSISTVYLLLIGAAGIAAAVFAHRFLTRRIKPGELAALFFWTGADLACAALALFILLPNGTELSFSTLFAAYVIALGLGLASNAPGGIGAFDLALLGLLPAEHPESVVGAIIAFRLAYYVLPALLGLMSVAKPARQPMRQDLGPASWGLSIQSGELQSIGGTPWHIRKLPFLTCSIGPRSTLRSSPNALMRFALGAGGLPAMYNCDGRAALAARRAGWTVKRTAMEAIIRPQSWTKHGRKKQTLRRKIRLAERAGITIQEIDQHFPIEALMPIAKAWAKSRGGEHGFSMGYASTTLMAKQKNFVIRQDGEPVGFLSFHTNETEWVLDLLRHGDDLPDGAMHAGIAYAIERAQANMVETLSLASVPDPRTTPEYWSKTRAGLTQFKRNFDPIWVGRYHAAPNEPWFWISGTIITLAIHRPLANSILWTQHKLALAQQSRPVRRFAIAVLGQT